MTKRANRERGAALIEMALLTPFLALLLMGVIEFGWALGQMNDIRYGAREAARLAAANAGDTATMTATVCSSMDLSGGQTISFTDSAGGDIGDEVTVSVSAPAQSVTGAGLIANFLPSTLSVINYARLEEPSTNWSTGSGVCP